MGQNVKRHKRGRPATAKLDLHHHHHRHRRPLSNTDLRRSSRRRNVKYVFELDDYFDDEEDDHLFPSDDEEQRRRAKKLKHLLKIDAEDTESTPRRASTSSSASSDDDDGGRKPRKKRKIDVDMDDENDEDYYCYNDNNYEDDDEYRESEPEPRTRDLRMGSPADRMSGIPMPDKKSLELILDKLQKKDIYGVYAEPVDPEELPDYHDVIKHPMDFATVRNKLRRGLYATFEQFESDVFLICSNAMQYNAPDTVYHKQARSIQELARKKFQKIGLKAKHVEEIKAAEKKTRSESNLDKQIKRSGSLTVQEPVGSDFSSGATLATAADVRTHNGASIIRPVETEKLGGNDGLAEGNNNVENAEESQSGKSSMPRFSRKSSVQDENRRATYSISLSLEENVESILSNFEGDGKQLVPVGLYSDHSYARSLARFTASLGSVPWKVASARIEQALPEGFKFGRGWVEEYEPLPTPKLILENCNVREPPYLKKVQRPVESWKSVKIPTFSVPSHDPPGNVPFLDQRLPFSGPAGFRPPYISITAPQPITGNNSEIKAPFFLAAKPSNSPNSSVQHQNLRGAASFAMPENKVPKQVESNGRTTFSNVRNKARLKEVASKNINLSKPASFFQQPESNGVAFGGVHDGKAVGNNVNITKMSSSASLLAKPAHTYLHKGNQALSDPVQLMRNLSGKAQSQPKPSDHTLPSSLGTNDPNNAAVATARAWMSVGAGGFEQARESPNLSKNQIYADSLYNSSREMQSPASKCYPAGNVLMDKNGSPVQPFVVPQGGQAHMNMTIAYQNQRMVFPQPSTGNLSRLQQQSNWRNTSPQMMNPQIISRQKQESRPPDLNIGYQSPGKTSSGVVDSQQPDLALQL